MSSHSRNLLYADEQEQIPVASKEFHWQPVRSTNRMADIALRSGTRGLWHPSGCGGRGGNSGSILAQSSSVNFQLAVREVCPMSHYKEARSSKPQLFDSSSESPYFVLTPY